MNDICNVTNKLDIISFADDTTLTSYIENFKSGYSNNVETNINLKQNKK